MSSTYLPTWPSTHTFEVLLSIFVVVYLIIVSRENMFKCGLALHIEAKVVRVNNADTIRVSII
jgi:hypothetical protein